MLRNAMLVVALSALFAVARFGTGEIDVNVSPLARVSVNGRSIPINSDAPVPRRFYEVVTDGFVDDQYVAELPSVRGAASLELEFPWEVRIDRLILIGWSGAGKGTVEVSSLNRTETNWNVPEADWSATDGRSPLLNLSPPIETSSLRFEFRCDGPAVVNSIQCYVRASRWKAYLWFAGLQVVIPWCYGGIWAAAVVGWGRLLHRRAKSMNELSDVGRSILVGITAMSAMSSAWLLLPDAWRHGPAEVVASVLTFGPGILLIVQRPLKSQRRLLIAFGATAMLLLSTVAVESTIVANRRVKPMDHLFGLMTAQHLAEHLPVPDEMVLRPWLVPILAIPESLVGGRFSYWLYLGQMAWINVLGLAMIASIAPRFGIKSVTAAALIGLLPLTTAFHFPGQRILVAGLSLFAVNEWTRRTGSKWWWWGGWAATMAILAHPGALFVLPGAAIYFLFVKPRSSALLGMVSIGVAVSAYLAWVQFSAIQYPNVHNNLAYYPVMRTLDDVPPSRSWREIVAALPQDHWKTLAENRLTQFRHYLWADNPWQTALFERTRAISLTTSLGVVLSLIALLSLKRFQNTGWIWVAIICPLLSLHLHLGQSFPQFHILPTPFFAFALIGLVALNRLGAWTTKLVVAEAFLHALFVPALLSFGLAGSFELPGWFLGDEVSKWLCLLPLFPWTVLAATALRRNQ